MHATHWDFSVTILKTYIFEDNNVQSYGAMHALQVQVSLEGEVNWIVTYKLHYSLMNIQSSKAGKERVGRRSSKRSKEFNFGKWEGDKERDSRSYDTRALFPMWMRGPWTSLLLSFEVEGYPTNTIKEQEHTLSLLIPLLCFWERGPSL